MPEPATPSLFASVDAMLTGATDRTPVHAPDGKSGSTFERLRINGEPRFLKSLSYDDDWLMRITPDTRYWPTLGGQAGLYQRTRSTIDHTIVAMALEGQGPSARMAFLMRDVGPALI